MPNTTPQRRAGSLWLVVAVLAVITLALGLWDLVVERDGGENWLLQALFPLLLLVFALAMYRRQRGNVVSN
jgi:putative copper export protein